MSTRSYPLWANGTAGLVANPASAESGWKTSNTRNDPCVQALGADRPQLIDQNNERPVNQLRFRFPLKRPQGGQNNVCLGGSQVSYDFDVGVGSDWYYWIKFLATRYNPTPDKIPPQPTGPYEQLGLNPSNGAVIDYLEFVNEPNSAEGWPQLDASGAMMISPTVVANMFQDRVAHP